MLLSNSLGFLLGLGQVQWQQVKPFKAWYGVGSTWLTQMLTAGIDGITGTLTCGNWIGVDRGAGGGEIDSKH